LLSQEGIRLCRSPPIKYVTVIMKLSPRRPALKVLSFVRIASMRASAAFSADREIHVEHTAGFEQLRQRLNRLGIAWNGIRVHAAPWTEHPIDIGIRVEPAQDDDDAFDDRGAKPSVRAHPRSVEPAFNRFHLVLTRTGLALFLFTVAYNDALIFGDAEGAA
jgi:hypothetical protein